MQERTKAECRRILTGEVVTAGVCVYLIYLVLQNAGNYLDLRVLVPGVMLILTLAAECGYWLYRYKLADGANFRRGPVLAFFAKLKRFMPVLYAFYPLFLIVMLILDAPSILTVLTVFCVVVWAFAIIEYINLFKWTVNFRSFHKPSELAQELKTVKEEGGH